MNLNALQPSIERAVKDAGDIVLSYFNKALERHEKSDGSFATDADLASEKHLIETLKVIVPEAGFYAEESGVTSKSEYMWVIDPLDGTTNFSQGIPYFCISVALTRNEERLIGAVYQPITHEFFYAVKGAGATLNGNLLKIVEKADFGQSVIGCDTACILDEVVSSPVVSMAQQIYSLRIFGASALDIVYCAANRLDAVLFCRLCWWDVAAASLILEEAGGLAQGLIEEKLGCKTISFMGGSRLIFEKLAHIIKK